MVSSRVIRIDQEVWAELQRQAIPFEDNPNSVLRRIFGLGQHGGSRSDGSGANDLDPRVAKLLQLVEALVGHPVATSPTKSGQSYRFKSQRGKIVAFLYPQNRRLKVETSKQMATEAGINAWDHCLTKGWWGQHDSVYWYIPYNQDEAYEQVAGVLDRLWRR